MKSIVVEIKKDIAIVLSDDGSFNQIHNNNYVIGQEIHMKKTKSKFAKKLATIAGTAAAIGIIFTGFWAYSSPYYYVSLDVNPSIEFTLNRFDRVLSVKGANDDGEEILKEIDLNELEYTSVENAINKTVEQISENGYFTEDEESNIVITASSKDSEESEALAKELEQSITEDLTENEELPEKVAINAQSVGRERVEEARALGVTPGKLNLVQKLQASAQDPESIILEEWLDKPVKDIMKAIKANRKGEFVADIEVPASGAEVEDGSEETTLNPEQIKEEAKEAFELTKSKAKNIFEMAKENAMRTFELAKAEAMKLEGSARDEAIMAAELIKDAAIQEAELAKDATIEEAERVKELALEEVANACKKEQKEAQKAVREEEKEQAKANKEAEKAAKELAKEQEKADREAEKAAQKLEKEQEKAERKKEKESMKNNR